MQYKYGEMFERLGVTGMGRQGAGWCGVDANGVLVLMSHQNFFGRENGGWIYVTPGHEHLPTSSTAAAKSCRMIAEYFAPGKDILLPVGDFALDGEFLPNGTHVRSKFRHATGDVYRATIREFDAGTGRIVCDVVEKFAV